MRRAWGALAALAALGIGGSAWACVPDAQTACIDPTDEPPVDIRCATLDPNIEEIVLLGDIELGNSTVDCGQWGSSSVASPEIAGHADGGLRNLTIRSENGPHRISIAESSEGLFKCWPAGPVNLDLRGLEFDGGQVMGTLVSRDGDCGVSLDSVWVHDFQPGGGHLLDVEGDMHMEVFRSRFDDISGRVFKASGGLLTLTQSVFSNCGQSLPGGVVSLTSVAEATVTGCLFWGNHSEESGGAIHADASAGLLIEGSAFVGNSAPVGGAVMWESQATLGLLHSIFAANAATDSWIAGPLPDSSLPDTSCNFEWWADPSLPSAPTVADGTGGALAVNTGGTEVNIFKTVFLENRAGSGGALAAVRTVDWDEPRAPEDEEPGWGIGLIHNTFVANEADEGAALWGEGDGAAYLVAVNNLWLDHSGDPLAFHEDTWNVVLAGNHTDGPPLADGVSQPTWEVEETCGQRPQMQVCTRGCDPAEDEEICGAVYGDVPQSWGFPVALHFGHELCPVADAGSCEDLDEAGCTPLETPCVWQAGLDDEYFAMADGPADRGFTGLECHLWWNFLPDADGDHVPDFAECDAAGEPAASEDGDRHPFAEELCNGLDDNCDGRIDEGLLVEYYEDLDGDGHGGGDPVLSCDPLGDLFTTADDCDDTDASVHPAAIETHDDGKDNDCDGVVDLDAPGCHSAGCLATRVAPGDDGLQLSFAPVGRAVVLRGRWGMGRRLRRR